MTAPTISETLALRRQSTSPRFSPPPTPLASTLIHAAVLLLWVALFWRAFQGGGLFAWSAGLVYIAYDTLLLCFVFRRTLVLLRPPATAAMSSAALPTTTVIIAARNEADVLQATLASLFAQTGPPDIILIADDGSDDGTASLLANVYQLKPMRPGESIAAGDRYPSLRWLRLPRGGKAASLNIAVSLAETDLVLTIDADTLIDPSALAAMRNAFAADPTLVAATGC